MSAATGHGRPTVVVVGGGYGGTQVAKELDGTADVVLVEPKEAFFHNVAALRALADPTWAPRIFFPYDGLLTNGRVVRDRAVQVEPDRVVTASGEEIRADYVVLATGSSYTFPAKTDLVHTDRAVEQIEHTHQELAGAERVLLVGAGPVGIELAGEIRHVWPDKSIVLFDVAPQVLDGPFLPELKEELRRQLAASEVEVMLGSPLRELPPTEPGVREPFTVATEDGTEVTADLWFRCFGVAPNSEYLADGLATARRADGFVEVEPTLQVIGQSNVFALGDLSTADTKMAAFAGYQAAVVAANITAMITGESELSEYVPAGPGIAVTFGPTGGAGQFPGQDGMVGPEVIAAAKGRDMMVDRFGERFGLHGAAVD